MATNTEFVLECSVSVKRFQRVNLIHKFIERNLEQISNNLDRDECPKDIKESTISRFRKDLSDLKLFIILNEDVNENEFEKLISELLCEKYNSETIMGNGWTKTHNVTEESNDEEWKANKIEFSEFEDHFRRFREKKHTCVCINLLKLEGHASNLLPFSDDSVQRDFESCVYHVYPKELKSRTEAQNILENLRKRFLWLDEHAESQGCRLFHLRDSLLRGTISRRFEEDIFVRCFETINYFTNILQRSESFEQMLSTYLAQKEEEVFVWADQCEIKDENLQIVQLPLRFTKQESISYQKQLMIFLLEKLCQTLILEWKYQDCHAIEGRRRHSIPTALRAIPSYLNGRLTGMILCEMKFVDEYDVNENWKKKVASNLTKFLMLPRTISLFKEELIKIRSYFRSLQQLLPDMSAELKKMNNRLTDEIPFHVQVSLNRIHGVRSMRLWYKKKIVLVDEEIYEKDLERTKEKILEIFSTEDDVTIEKFQQIRFCHGIRQGTKLLRVADDCFGSLATFVKDKEGNLYCLTCHHVAPLDSEISIIDCSCDEVKEKGCNCKDRIKIGKVKHGIGTEESRWEWLIDLSAITIEGDLHNDCDMSIVGCEGDSAAVEEFHGKFEEVVQNRVYKWGAQTKFTEGQYAGVEVVTSDSPDCPSRKFDLIQSRAEFGLPGDSGSLVSICNENENRRNVVSPAFIFIGENKRETFHISYCFRLHESLQCMEQKYGKEFSPCFQNGNKGKIRLSKRTALILDQHVEEGEAM